ncbi:Hypothetical protein SMAX5B_021290 [Scophthalmus maximus]|uniref:Uncharacterized protein n=1 Tax=Scophthalmus maximus TaxID=52904 RepID=A0A2U9BLX8_SCOMX|nr:Hypothetical protein SMAX5B_021290 [Scophthalmus maximus]
MNQFTEPSGGCAHQEEEGSERTTQRHDSGQRLTSGLLSTGSLLLFTGSRRRQFRNTVRVSLLLVRSDR